MKKLKSKELNPDKINANVQKDGKSQRPPKQRERYIHVPIKENDKLGKVYNIQFKVRTMVSRSSHTWHIGYFIGEHQRWCWCCSVTCVELGCTLW